MPSLMEHDFAARCKDCGFTWNTPAMADGLRVLGCCPKCRGALEFGARSGFAPAEGPVPPGPEAAPHMVLGIPRI
jgi:hypothetical protein